jgi:hypothetical protein
MKATLEYTLPEETHDFEIACKAASYRAIIVELKESLRTWKKHGHDFKDGDHAVDYIEGYLIELCHSEGMVIE